MGTDGPAIRNLVTRLNGMIGTLSDRQGDIRTIVTEFSRLASMAAQHKDQLRQGLRQLPPTLETARTTLEKIPGTADEVVPLLEDLKRPTDKLVPVSEDLKAVLHDLRPALHDLGPTIKSLNKLFDNTPGLLDALNSALDEKGGDGLTAAVDYLNDPLNYLRPYTPEAIGWLSNWNSTFSSYDSNGKYFRVFVQEPYTSLPAQNPGVLPPGVSNNPHPMPGANGGTPWTDAWGSGIR